MPTEGLVTILVITYNHKEYIKKCLDSILSQTTNFNFKILICDDSSTDGNEKICQDYSNKYPNIIDFTPRSKNLGVVENIYDGISKINTKYFATIEADDYWCDDTKLQKQIEILELNPDCSFCGHNTAWRNNDGTISPIFNKSSHNIQSKYSFPKTFNAKMFVKVHPSSRVYRTSLIDYTNLKMKDSLVWDSSSYWYFLSKGNLYYIDEVMSVYNYTLKGVFSGSTQKQQTRMAVQNILNINKELDFKFNRIFSKLLLKYKKELGLNILDALMLKLMPTTYYNKLTKLLTQK